ncbi:zinc finger protein 711-like isoform X2 [Epargyreus clarus]
MPLKRKKRGRPPKAKVYTKKEQETQRDFNLSCEICNSTFVTKQSLQRHEKLCQEGNSVLCAAESNLKALYSCKECNKKFRFKVSYELHLKNDHASGPGSVACDSCAVRCPDKKTLRDHITKVHERKIFECEHCKKKFVRRSHVIRHMSQRGCDGLGVTIFHCEICKATFTRKDNLIVHLRLQHIRRGAFPCKHCTYHTKSFSRLISHYRQYHSESPNKFVCDHCGKDTRSRTAMAKHLEIHGERKYECSVCGYSTYTIEVMRRHVLTHVENKPHKCTLCQRSYIQRVQLQRHMQKHFLTCTECGVNFKSKAKLTAHTRERLGLCKLVCPVADVKKEFVNTSGLQSHISNAHVIEKEYVCEVCSKSFSNEMNMRRHMSTHKLERPRRCMYCVAARAYVRGEQLVRHVRRAHHDVFRAHLNHVRQVFGSNLGVDRVRKSEMDSILNLLDAESERILEGYGLGVLYGGIQESRQPEDATEGVILKVEGSPLMSEEELAESLNKLLEQLIDKDTLECFGWPDETVDNVLEKVIEHCGARAADRDKWTRVQCLRENAKHLFLYVVEDEAIERMLHTHTIDQIIKHILLQGSQDEAEEDVMETE